MRTILLFDLPKGFSRALDLVSPSLAGHHLRVALLSRKSSAERMRIPHSTRKCHDAHGQHVAHPDVHCQKAIPAIPIFEHNKGQHCRAGGQLLV